MTTEIKNHCARLIVGQGECKHHINNGKCAALTSKCSGNEHGIGADPVLAQLLVENKKKEITRMEAVERLIKHHSTEQGLEHLSNLHAERSSPVPFR